MSSLSRFGAKSQSMNAEECDNETDEVDVEYVGSKHKVKR